MKKIILYCQCRKTSVSSNSVSSAGIKILRVGKERYEICQSLSVPEEQLEVLKSTWNKKEKYIEVQGITVRLIPPYPST